ncbi:MAG: carbohydrate ABC transporter permease [Oscillospiraceae bacterium]|nr:carbohydrate ABC transporter permease [Oscillospiraceae bacterium]
MTAYKKIVDIIVYIALILIAIAVVFPVFFIFTNSFMSENEIIKSYGDNTKINMHFIPDKFSLQGYINVFLINPAYLMKFWNSVFISAAIMTGQVFVSCLGGYGFAKFKFPLKNVIFYFMIILMMMPVQVMLVPNYIVFEKINLIGSYTAVILPGIFSTFGVFLITQVFSSIPDNLIEAAKIDGANHLQILFKIAIPCCKAGVASLFVLNFIDNWNMVEQPLIFLKDPTKYPLSVFLSNINQSKLGISFVCGILAIIPVFLLFLHLKDSLIYGIENANLK